MRASAVRLHTEASAEYDAAFDWYLQRSLDAALRFDAEVDRAFTQIAQAPHRWPVGPFGTRKFLRQQFPFFWFYRELVTGDIQIVAVAHTSRRPEYWKRRL